MSNTVALLAIGLLGGVTAGIMALLVKPLADRLQSLSRAFSSRSGARKASVMPTRVGPGTTGLPGSGALPKTPTRAGLGTTGLPGSDALPKTPKDLLERKTSLLGGEQGLDLEGKLAGLGTVKLYAQIGGSLKAIASQCGKASTPEAGAIARRYKAVAAVVAALTAANLAEKKNDRADEYARTLRRLAAQLEQVRALVAGLAQGGGDGASKAELAQHDGEVGACLAELAKLAGIGEKALEALKCAPLVDQAMESKSVGLALLLGKVGGSLKAIVGQCEQATANVAECGAIGQRFKAVGAVVASLTAEGLSAEGDGAEEKTRLLSQLSAQLEEARGHVAVRAQGSGDDASEAELARLDGEIGACVLELAALGGIGARARELFDNARLAELEGKVEVRLGPLRLLAEASRSLKSIVDQCEEATANMADCDAVAQRYRAVGAMVAALTAKGSAAEGDHAEEKVSLLEGLCEQLELMRGSVARLAQGSSDDASKSELAQQDGEICAKVEALATLGGLGAKFRELFENAPRVGQWFKVDLSAGLLWHLAEVSRCLKSIDGHCETATANRAECGAIGQRFKAVGAVVAALTAQGISAEGDGAEHRVRLITDLAMQLEPARGLVEGLSRGSDDHSYKVNLAQLDGEIGACVLELAELSGLGAKARELFENAPRVDQALAIEGSVQLLRTTSGILNSVARIFEQCHGATANHDDCQAIDTRFQAVAAAVSALNAEGFAAGGDGAEEKARLFEQLSTQIEQALGPVTGIAQTAGDDAMLAAHRAELARLEGDIRKTVLALAALGGVGGQALELFENSPLEGQGGRLRLLGKVRRSLTSIAEIVRECEHAMGNHDECQAIKKRFEAVGAAVSALTTEGFAAEGDDAEEKARLLEQLSAQLEQARAHVIGIAHGGDDAYLAMPRAELARAEGDVRTSVLALATLGGVGGQAAELFESAPLAELGQARELLASVPPVQ